MRVMLRQRPVQPARMAPVPQLRCPMSILMANHRLDRLAVVRFVTVAWRLPIVEILADLIPREDLRRNQARADVAAVIAQNEAVEAGFLRRPRFPWRNQDRPPRRSGRSAKNKGVDALAAEHLHIRHLPRLLLHDDRGGRAPGESYDQKRGDNKFRAHNDLVEQYRRSNLFESKPPVIYSPARPPTGFSKIFKRTCASAREEKETNSKENIICFGPSLSFC